MIWVATSSFLPNDATKSHLFLGPAVNNSAVAHQLGTAKRRESYAHGRIHTL